MKRLITSLATVALIGSLLASSAFADSSANQNQGQEPEISTESLAVQPVVVDNNNSSDGVIVPYGVEGPYGFQWSGNGSTTFEYRAQSTGSSESVRLVLKNNGSTTFKYILTSPTGSQWISGFELAPGKSVEHTMTWNPSLAGYWKLYFQSVPTGYGSVSFQLRTGLDAS